MLFEIFAKRGLQQIRATGNFAVYVGGAIYNTDGQIEITQSEY